MKKKNEIVAKDWLHLQELLFSHYDDQLQRHRSPYVYRGAANKKYDLQTSLMRLNNSPEKMERHLFRSFKKYAPRDSVIENNDWNWLSLAQHHGLPTRLLDWSFSPYVALHFMCEDLHKYDHDGAIWCADFYSATKLLPQKLQERLDRKGYKVFSVDILNKLFPKFEEGLAKLEKHHNQEFLLFFEPPSLDSRIVNQYALFSVLTNPNSSLDHWFEVHPQLHRRIIIPKELKWEIRDKLDQANITERVIYPGLDGLSKWLRRWYTKK